MSWLIFCGDKDIIDDQTRTLSVKVSTMDTANKLVIYLERITAAQNFLNAAIKTLRQRLRNITYAEFTCRCFFSSETTCNY